ncbi:putative nuclease HARBI1 [Prorops nasuta]|uniref:putative nuclease HARBI1 n=1 Tax=Prorops nasuta TaxID=863751 RepID=UPI0034CFDC05
MLGPVVLPIGKRLDKFIRLVEKPAFNIFMSISVCDRFNLCKSTVWKCVFNTSYVLQNHVNDYIKWPQYRELMQNQNNFQEVSNFPGIVGVIDGCHIRISAPINYPNSYINRKGYHSIILQGICDSKRKFIDVFIGYCGSVHDARVWQYSHIKELIDNDNERYCPKNSHLIGDSAYPLTKVLLTPYKDNGHLTDVQINYNRKLSSTRMVIERTFGLLKCRWRKLNYIYMFNVEMIPLIILASCILHNICLEHELEPFELDVNENEYNRDEDEHEDENENDDVHENVFQSAEEKREIIANLIY